jgi:ABC-type antimicrobial peptide transport system permease subunit
MAIGSSRRDVVAFVLRDGLRHVLTGVVVGLGTSTAMRRLASGWLPGLTTAGVAVHGLAIAVVIAAAAVASAAPERRATRVDPMVALRDG